MYFFTYFGKKTAMQIDQHSKYGKQVLQRHFGNVNLSTLPLSISTLSKKIVIDFKRYKILDLLLLYSIGIYYL